MSFPFQEQSFRQHQGERRESFQVKNKMLLWLSLAAMLMSAVLLIAPANASVTSHCTHCTAVDSTGATVTATCHVRPIDGCFCPLTGTITFNNCQFIGATHPQ